MDRMTELQKRKLKNMLNTCESMKRTFSQKRDAVIDEEEPHEMCFDFEKAFHGAKMDEE